MDEALAERVYLLPQDPENQLTFEIEGLSTANEFFNIDPFTGLIRISKALTQSTPNIYNVSVVLVGTRAVP